MQVKSRVLTLVHRHFSHSFMSHRNDQEGRESFLKISHGGTEFTLCNVYGPDGDNSGVFQNLGVRLQSSNMEAIKLGGYLNTVRSPLEDGRGGSGSSRTPSHRASEDVLPALLRISGLRDDWRDVHPEGREYNFFSHANQSWSRIDYLLISEQLTPRLILADIWLISDHALVIVRLADAYPKGSDFKWRFPAHLVRDESFRELLRGWWLEYSSLNETHREDPSLFWNTVKAVLRGRIISYVTTCTKKTKLAHDMANSK